MPEFYVGQIKVDKEFLKKDLRFLQNKKYFGRDSCPAERTWTQCRLTMPSENDYPDVPIYKPRAMRISTGSKKKKKFYTKVNKNSAYIYRLPQKYRKMRISIVTAGELSFDPAWEKSVRAFNDYSAPGQAALAWYEGPNRRMQWHKTMIEVDTDNRLLYIFMGVDAFLLALFFILLCCVCCSKQMKGTSIEPNNSVNHTQHPMVHAPGVVVQTDFSMKQQGYDSGYNTEKQQRYQ